MTNEYHYSQAFIHIFNPGWIAHIIMGIYQALSYSVNRGRFETTFLKIQIIK